MIHIDDWLDRAVVKAPSEAEVRCRLFLEVARMPAWKQHLYKALVGPAFCTFRGDRYRCTGASRLGDVWLTRDIEQDSGYQLRVDVAECGYWSEKY